MYTKDKNNRITLRLNDKQMKFILRNAEILDVSPSDFIRMLINSNLALVEIGGAERRENETADINDII